MPWRDETAEARRHNPIQVKPLQTLVNAAESVVPIDVDVSADAEIDAVPPGPLAPVESIWKPLWQKSFGFSR